MNGLGIAAIVILGPVGLFLAVAMALRIRERLREGEHGPGGEQ
jgi:hypothetical protein